MVDYFSAKGGELHMNARLREIVLNPDGSVKELQMVNGDKVGHCLGGLCVQYQVSIHWLVLRYCLGALFALLLTAAAGNTCL
jgi:hypothetical protein